MTIGASHFSHLSRISSATAVDFLYGLGVPVGATVSTFATFVFEW